MANENETVMAVCAEWRACIEAADPSVWNDERIAGLVKTTKAQQLVYLDRIDAAARREREAARAYWTKKCRDTIAEHDRYCSPVGNAAAMREALISVRRDLWDLMGTTSEALRNRIATNIRAAIRAALSEPARNCDRFADETDAQIAFLNEVWLISVTKETALERDRFENWTDEMRSSYAKWLFAPAAERKGEGDGR